jgi:hypothetical protein
MVIMCRESPPSSKKLLPASIIGAASDLIEKPERQLAHIPQYERLLSTYSVEKLDRSRPQVRSGGPANGRVVEPFFAS